MVEPDDVAWRAGSWYFAIEIAVVVQAPATAECESPVRFAGGAFA